MDADVAADVAADVVSSTVADYNTNFEIFVSIVAREGNIPVCTVFTLSRLGKWYYAELSHLLARYRALYYQWAPRLARAYHRKLIGHPIEYTGSTTRIIPAINLQGYKGGILILNSDPPIFTDEFLAGRRPALASVCLLTNKPAPFFYKFGLCTGQVLRSGYTLPGDYTELSHDDDAFQRMQQEFPDIPAANVFPGRYWVKLDLDLDINPLLFSNGLYRIDDVLFVGAYNLTYYDAGDHLEPTLHPDIRVVIDNLTHVIAHFKTTSAEIAPEYKICTKDIRKFSTVKKISRNDHNDHNDRNDYNDYRFQFAEQENIHIAIDNAAAQLINRGYDLADDLLDDESSE